jgi:5-methylcytosine-specific restriction endonuclease McrA
MDDIVTEKICRSCGIQKSAKEFYRHKHHSDGLTSYCKNCNNARGRKWHAEHLEYSRKIHRDYSRGHKEQNAERMRHWRANHPEVSAAQIKAWRKNNPEKNRNQKRQRRARKKGIGGQISVKEWNELKNKYGNICLCCKRKDIELTMDHIIPLNPGMHTVDNIQPLCRSCNSKKKRKTIDYRPDGGL